MFFIISVLLSALLLVTSGAQLQSGEGVEHDQIYYIIASSTSSCLVGQCLTLSQFARNTSLYLMENTALIFKDDFYTLDSQLSINGVHNFSARAERTTANSTVITCRKSFVFENINEVYIDGLLFIGCRNNHIKSVTQFSITNCTFDGQHDNGTALFIIDSSVDMSGCRFIRTLSSFYYNSLQYYESSDQNVGGGAIIGNNSDISISGCIFEENMAQIFGAVIAIEKESKLVITDTNFHQNQIGLRGRGVYSDSGCSVVVANCSFLENAFDTGTLIEAYESSIIFQECIFHHNQGNISLLIRCFDSNVTLMETLIEFNYMFGCIGVSNILLPTSLNIINSAFNGNRVSSLVVVGCFIGNCSTSTASIQSSHFVKNINVFIAIYNLAGSTYMYVQDSTFAGNRAQSGVIQGGNIYIEDSSFIGNMANDGNIYLTNGICT